MSKTLKTLATAVDAVLDDFEAAAMEYVDACRAADKAAREPGRFETPYARAIPYIKAAIDSRLARLTKMPRDPKYWDSDERNLPLTDVRTVASHHG